LDGSAALQDGGAIDSPVGSQVTAVAQISTTITTATGSSSESASTEASIDVCPDVGGLAIGTFKLVADGSTSTGSTYHVAADQKFSIVVGDDAETIGIDFAGSMTYVSTGPNANELTLAADLGYGGLVQSSYSNGGTRRTARSTTRSWSPLLRHVRKVAPMQ
jgi:hypothetical protein